MGFGKQEEEKIASKPSIAQMGLQTIEDTLARYAANVRFLGQESSERTQNNCNYISKWAEMSSDEFFRRVQHARAQKKAIDFVSGARTEDGSIRMPVDDDDQYIFPTLDVIISLQRARLDRIAYAKEKTAEELGGAF